MLPKNISDEDLDHVMDQWNDALGVKCGFCHASSKTDSKKLDFASDEKHEKEIARDMYRMTMKINKKYFNYNASDSKVLAVGCKTCHRGNPHAEE